MQFAELYGMEFNDTTALDTRAEETCDMIDMDFTNHISIELPEGYICNVDETFSDKESGKSFHELFNLNIDMNA